ncbi:MAG: acyltransferase [Chloroflexota bacterium]
MSSGGVLEIGDRTTINYGSSIAVAGLVRLGAHCRLGTYVMLVDNDFHAIARRGKLPKPRPIILEDNVWLANGSMVLPGVTIGHDSVIGAGSVVTANIPPRSVAFGNPARVIRTF